MMKCDIHETAELPAVRLRLIDWVWYPWYAKLWWAAIPIYWGGCVISLKVPALASFYDTLPAAFLALFLNPFILLLLLGAGLMRAKLDRGEWIVTAHTPRWQEQPGKTLDPYTDPSDPKSGTLFLRYIGDYDH